MPQEIDQKLIAEAKKSLNSEISSIFLENRTKSDQEAVEALMQEITSNKYNPFSKFDKSAIHHAHAELLKEYNKKISEIVDKLNSPKTTDELKRLHTKDLEKFRVLRKLAESLQGDQRYKYVDVEFEKEELAEGWK